MSISVSKRIQNKRVIWKRKGCSAQYRPSLPLMPKIHTNEPLVIDTSSKNITNGVNEIPLPNSEFE